VEFLVIFIKRLYYTFLPK